MNDRDKDGFDLRYHVPRSQVWGGSRGRQSGNVHLHVRAKLDIGRIHRALGQALCGKSRGWYEREPMAGEDVCPRCEEIAARVGWLEDAHRILGELRLAAVRAGAK